MENKSLNNSIKSWYLEHYPEDIMGHKIPDASTLSDVVLALNEDTSLRNVLGSYDDIVRRRIFDGLSKCMFVPLQSIYDKWSGVEGDLVFDNIAYDIAQNPNAARGFTLISVEDCFDDSYGASIIQYGRDDGSVCYTFSDISVKEALTRPELVLSELIQGYQSNNHPLWSDLSPQMLDLVLESSFDMLFIEHDDESWSVDLAEEIWDESLNLNLDDVVTLGEDCYIAVFAGAMCNVNWEGHPVHGKPCLENKLIKTSLSEQIQSASSRITNPQIEENTATKNFPSER